MTRITPETRIEAEATESLNSVRSTLSLLLDSLNLSSVPSLELARTLDIDKSLAWKISQLATARDIATLGEHSPGSAGWEIFLKAVRRAGADTNQTNSVRNSVADFDALVKRHAGDRATFGMIAGGLGGEGAKRIETTHRRQLFKGASYVWGLQAGVLFYAHFVAPSEKDDILDAVIVRGIVNLQRLRREAVCVLGPYHVCSDRGEVYEQDGPQALDPDYAATHLVPFMGDFCTKPLPPARRVQQDDGTGYDLLEMGPVGKPGVSTFITGEYLPACVPWCQQPGDEYGQHIAWVRMPAESLVLDVYIDKSLTSSIEPELVVYSKLEQTGAAMTPDFLVQLPTCESLESLGQAPVTRPVKGIRNYGRMINAVCDRVGWKTEQFEVFRVHLAYPPVATCAIVRYLLPT